MSERPRATTLMNPPELPQSYNFSNFLRGLTILDIKHRQSCDGLKKAMNAGKLEEVERLTVQKKQQADAIIRFLVQAYIDTKGAISKIAHFDPRSELCIGLSIEDEGQLLWLKIEYQIEQTREEQRVKFEEIMPDKL